MATHAVLPATSQKDHCYGTITAKLSSFNSEMISFTFRNNDILFRALC
jgi:hypothetical protein